MPRYRSAATSCAALLAAGKENAPVKAQERYRTARETRAQHGKAARLARGVVRQIGATWNPDHTNFTIKTGESGAAPALSLIPVAANIRDNETPTAANALNVTKTSVQKFSQIACMLGLNKAKGFKKPGLLTGSRCGIIYS